MIALGETDPTAAELLFRLPLSADPIHSWLTGHSFASNATSGEVKIQLPGAGWINPPGSQIVEKGLGWYAVRLTAAQCATAGVVSIRAVVATAQPFFDVEPIDIVGGDFALGEAGYIPFFLPNATDPINGSPITGHTFITGEVKLCVQGSTSFVNADVTKVIELGFGGYALGLDTGQTSVRGKAVLHVDIGSSSQPAGAFVTILGTIASTSSTTGSPTTVTSAALSAAGYSAASDHASLAVNRLPAQFAIKPKIVTLVRTLCGPMNDLETALQQLLINRTIDTAAGAQLDILGRIVGQLRLGLSDTDYRRYIRARIATDNSNGVIADLLSIAVLILDTQLVTPITVQFQQPATVVMMHFAGALNDTISATVYAFLRAGASAGVRIIWEWIDVIPAQVFRLDAGPGFDQGHLAGSLG